MSFNYLTNASLEEARNDYLNALKEAGFDFKE